MKNELEIIDWESKGNIVRFYLGKNGKQWGDDWDDAPYEHNAGKVYDEFVVSFKDVTFPFEYDVFCPSNDSYNSDYSKEDMIKRKVPCVVATLSGGGFSKAVADNQSKKYYFGDVI